MRTSLNNFITTLLVIAFLLSANSTAFSQYECQPQGAPTVINDSLVAADPDQNTRVFRGGAVATTTCLSALPPTSAPLAGTFNHDAHNFTNTTGQPACVTVKVTTACTGTNFIFVVAYSSFNPATPNTGIIGNIGGSPAGALGTPAYFSFPVAAGANYTVVVSEVTANAGCPGYTLEVETATACRQPGFDRNNDGAADFAVFRPLPLAQWFNRSTSTGTIESRQFGTTGDIPVHGDYTGDGQTDLAVYRPSNSTFYYATNQANPASGFVAIPWGVSGDIPVPGDYDSDGKHDINIFRPSDGNWYTLRSGSNTMQLMHWGTNGDIPVSGDFDGDSLADYAVARPAASNFYWFVLLSNFNYTSALTNAGLPGAINSAMTWGLPTDKIAVGDYNGDARSDVAVWRPSDGTAYIRFSYSATSAAIPWGTNGDIPQPADYDNDKITDFAIYRPSTNAFWVRPSGAGSPVVTFMGTAGDQPVSAPYRIQ